MAKFVFKNSENAHFKL